MSRSAVGHPFTQHATEPVPPVIARTEGAYVETADGKRILAAMQASFNVTDFREPGR
jgi:adenosylmethionine-8-amino-7-oxononanoate aminotransferase